MNDDTDWTDVATGAFHSCGIRGDDGQLFCWGDNRYGQLGIGNSTTQRCTTLRGIWLVESFCWLS